MNDDRAPRRDEDSSADLGEPILELADFTESPRPGFAGRVHNSIHRRLLASDLTDYAWFTPIRIIAEYLGMLFDVFDGQPKKRGDGNA